MNVLILFKTGVVTLQNLALTQHCHIADNMCQKVVLPTS